MVQPFADPCGRGVIEAQPCPRELRREIPARRRRVVLAACVLASSMALIDGSVRDPSPAPPRSSRCVCARILDGVD